jgi:hypothetical protein
MFILFQQEIINWSICSGYRVEALLMIKRYFFIKNLLVLLLGSAVAFPIYAAQPATITNKITSWGLSAGWYVTKKGVKFFLGTKLGWAYLAACVGCAFWNEEEEGRWANRGTAYARSYAKYHNRWRFQEGIATALAIARHAPGFIVKDFLLAPLSSFFKHKGALIKRICPPPAGPRPVPAHHHLYLHPDNDREGGQQR